jgi:hypothetical protein
MNPRTMSFLETYSPYSCTRRNRDRNSLVAAGAVELYAKARRRPEVERIKHIRTLGTKDHKSRSRREILGIETKTSITPIIIVEKPKL